MVPDSQPCSCFYQIQHLTNAPRSSLPGFPLIFSPVTECWFLFLPLTALLSLLQILPASFLGTEGNDEIRWKSPAAEKETLLPSTRAMRLNIHLTKVRAETAPSCQDPWGADSSITGAFGCEAHERSRSVTGILWTATGTGVDCRESGLPWPCFWSLPHPRLLCLCPRCIFSLENSPSPPFQNLH